MSIISGRWNFDGEPTETRYIDKVRSMLTPYSPDAGNAYSSGGISILYHAFHTTCEFHLEPQPLVTRTGSVFTWDGRLDNRDELLTQLKEPFLRDCGDVSIVAAAYERWGTQCYAKLVGDWALSVWNPNDRSLTLAKDSIGPRHLYYTFDKSQITWSTILEPLVLLAGKDFRLNEEYIAGWFSFFPATHLTPFVGIHSVPPASSVLIRNGMRTVSRYWDFNSSKHIRYKTDSDYEEHFRTLFEGSLRRRLRSDRPILAQLSGGVDSSSIVCMSDSLLSREKSLAPRLDTLSYFNDTEPNWNERPYFTRVEQKRGRTGFHVDVSSFDYSSLQNEQRTVACSPAACKYASSAARQIADFIEGNGYRVVLSGIGGDEVCGGVPTAIPELADLLAAFRLINLATQLKAWALASRRPWIQLLFETVRLFVPPRLLAAPKNRAPAPWLCPHFVQRHRNAFSGYQNRIGLFGARPSFQENVSALEAVRRQLTCTPLPTNPHYEVRYPYLDRSMLEFLYAIPREQVVRPGQRRSLMRRALAGIVPEEILNRRRKAFVARAPMAGIAARSKSLHEQAKHSISGRLGFVDVGEFLKALDRIQAGQEVPTTTLLRTLSLEHWLQGFDTIKQTHGIERSLATAAPESIGLLS